MMNTNDALLHELMDKVAAQVVGSIRDGIAATVEKEITTTLSRLLLQGEFLRKINTDMQEGLRDIYREISTARKLQDGDSPLPDGRSTGELFTETSDQLDKILQSTEQATCSIMDIVEKHQELQAEAGALLASLRRDDRQDAAGLDRLLAINAGLNQDLTQIMTALSFQDITGQRIKRIIAALKNVEAIVLDTYVSAGLKLKAREAAPDRDIEEVEAEAKRKVSELKGPQTGVSQTDVDGLLAQLGL